MSSPEKGALAMSHARRSPSTAVEVACALLFFLCVFACLAVTSAANSGTSRISSATPCATSRLVIWLDTDGDGAAGSIYYKLELTNASSATCTLTGYPGVSAVDLVGHQLGSPASRLPSPTKTVTLGAEDSAIATLRVVEAGNFPNAACHPVNAAGVRVYPPDERVSKFVPFPFQACAYSKSVVLGVSTAAS
jgi:hypothetical protein